MNFNNMLIFKILLCALVHMQRSEAFKISDGLPRQKLSRQNTTKK